MCVFKKAAHGCLVLVPVWVDWGASVLRSELLTMQQYLQLRGYNSSASGIDVAGAAGNVDYPGPYQGLELKTLRNCFYDFLVSLTNSGRPASSLVGSLRANVLQGAFISFKSCSLSLIGRRLRYVTFHLGVGMILI